MEKYLCKECGNILPEGAVSCPNCGCAAENANPENSGTVTCGECGAVLPLGTAHCTECGSPIGENSTPKITYPISESAVTCSKCGAQLNANQQFCPNCGTKAGKLGGGKKKIIIPIVAVLVCAAATAIFLIPPKVESISISQTQVEMDVDENFQATYTILPEKAANTNVEWTSNNESIVKVDETGNITAVGDGTTVVTVTAKGKSASINVTVKSGPDLKKVYTAIGGDGYYASVASDGSYISIDTNPLDLKSYSSNTAVKMIQNANKELGFPESTLTKMSNTRALDGMVTDTHDGVEASWTYHPNQGLEVTYSLVD